MSRFLGYTAFCAGLGMAATSLSHAWLGYAPLSVQIMEGLAACLVVGGVYFWRVRP